jgi:hypothetical protein
MASIAHARLVTYARPATVVDAVAQLVARARHEEFTRTDDGHRLTFRTRKTIGHPELDVVILVSAPIGQPTAIEIWLDRVPRGTGVGADAVAATTIQKAAERLRRDIRVALL